MAWNAFVRWRGERSNKFTRKSAIAIDDKNFYHVNLSLRSVHLFIALSPRLPDVSLFLSLPCFSCFMLRLKQLRKQHNIIRYVLKILTAREERKNLTPCCENYIGWDLFDVFLSRPCFLLISAVVASSSPEFWFRAFAARLICCTMQYDFCAARVPSFNFIPTFVFAIRLQ